MRVQKKRKQVTNHTVPVSGDLALNSSSGSTRHVSASKQASTVYRVAKRCFDFLSSLTVSIILLIPMAMIALIIVVKDFGNPFYVQKRVGRGGKDLLVANLRWMESLCMTNKHNCYNNICFFYCFFHKIIY